MIIIVHPAIAVRIQSKFINIFDGIIVAVGIEIVRNRIAVAIERMLCSAKFVRESIPVAVESSQVRLRTGQSSNFIDIEKAVAIIIRRTIVRHRVIVTVDWLVDIRAHFVLVENAVFIGITRAKCESIGVTANFRFDRRIAAIHGFNLIRNRVVVAVEIQIVRNRIAIGVNAFQII